MTFGAAIAAARRDCRHLPIALPVAREAVGGAGRVYVGGFHHGGHDSPLVTVESKEEI